MTDPRTARDRLVAALTTMIFTMPPGAQRDALARFLDGSPTIAELRAYLEANDLVDHGPLARYAN